MNEAAGRGILLIGHGTRSDAGTAEFLQLADRLQQLRPDAAVEAAFLELRPPSIADAWQRLMARSVGRIDAVPMLLFAAGHARRDIPAALAACARQHPQVALRVTRPLSRQRSLVALVAARVAAAVRDAECTDPRRAALVFVGRGSYDPCARTDMRLLVETVNRAIRRALPLASVDAAFYAMAQPPMLEVLARRAASGSIDCLIVQPLLLFEGQLNATIRQQVHQLATEYPQVRFHAGQHLGPDALLAQAVLGRLAELPDRRPTGCHVSC